MMRRNFQSDLLFGNKYEKKLTEIIPNDSYVIKEGYFPYYDIEINKDGKTEYYEVKADRFAYKSNNIIIEFECNKKSSGIEITKSDYYAYFIIKPYEQYELYIIPTNLIKAKIENREYKTIKTGGDLNSKMYIFNKDIFEEYKKQ